MKLADLQQAIYDRLTDEVGLSVSGIYTNVTQATESESDAYFPYITISPINSTPSDTKDMNGAEVLVDVNLWSRSTSALSDRSIMDDIYDALQKYDALAVSGANVIDCRFDSGTSFPDPDGKTRQYVSTWRVLYYDE